ncbi:carbon-nitrogen hydrolase family protein [Actinokineospora sp. NBRC 105648]|uniref:carbon-nitrogen hydrolase family protein n=1 Tax=Actinokineospora sp. NBRC 105648 TaxID=3032206 RepID=UPI0024A491CC|nr:carbon-nitrogen hydrolase family protein [Actinokineospora sp. NBRC 105648]GLZ39395.1 apolipoprotein acyltransferase [Actinokineospora sp. NBRC 105648]
MRVALCQINSTPDPAANLSLIRTGVAEAAARGATVVVFPEATMANFAVPLAPLAEPLDGPWATAVAEIARSADVVVSAGMFTPAPDGRVANTTLITGRDHHLGYDKIHLFDAFGFAESRTVAPGSAVVTFTVDDVTFGVATCYDIRFPELFRALADKGATAVLLGASWGAGPGKREQWELLVRARALDSTSWLLTAAQADPGPITGTAPLGIGYSTAANPRGEITAQLTAEPGLVVVEIDAESVETTRAAIPVLANRRL